ncbi:hypothetical protein [Streptomyces sp. ISL-94]|uniref:hypothetical protein n=1 Tax=Streptomyces sp. ISL-94 TaxID=2819190 RepID=UPI001BE6F583|nr:hypothetical protein [Streptomyces sp. ISL-94]MBT2478288.1 hypothetical protein [Streptomyces sp. ISL-94]
MSELMTPAFAGAAAGLGVAVPMGAMSVLLIQEAMRSRRVAAAAAAGIAAVDLGYAAVATALGPWVASHVSPIEAWVRLASALILLSIAARGLTKPHPSPLPAPPATEARDHVSAPPAIEARDHVSAPPAIEARGPGRSPAAPAHPAHRPDSHPAHPAPPSSEAPSPHPAAPALQARDHHPAPPAIEAPGPGRSPGSGTGRAFGRYVGLTALNPTTALYFAALTTAQGTTLHTGAAGTAFLVGVGAASLLWQQTLVALAALAGSRIPATARVWTFRLGYGLVAAYAVKIALPLP